MYRIVEFYAENFKRLRIVEFKPTGRMTVFTGKNGQGKTSALDVIPYVLAGKKWSPEMPTRKGATHHKGQLKIEGEQVAFIVTRTQSGVKIEPAPGHKQFWKTPQAMLDSIMDEMTLDPIEFIRMGKDAEGKRAQVAMLRKAITIDVDLDALAAENRRDFEARREINREIERLKGEINAIPVQGGLPNDPIDIGAIQAKIKEVNEHNRTIVQQIEARNRLAQDLAEAEQAEHRNNELINTTHAKIEKLMADLDAISPAGKAAAEIRDALEQLRDRAQALPDLDGIAGKLASAISDARVRALAYVPAAGQFQSQATHDLDQARKTLKAAEKMQKQLSTNFAEAQLALEQAPKPAMQDTAGLIEEMNQAQVVNREIERRNRQNELIKQREEKQHEANALTRAMEQREENSRAAIAGAKMPIEGLTFTEQEILFNGVPIAQLGEAEQLRISISIALARKPGLRLIRIPHGEALDEDSMAALAEMAEEQDFYVWMAKVDTTGTLGIYLEDGEVKAINEAPKSKKKGETA